jgi:hypothetical protein
MREDAHWCDLAPSLGDLGQSEKLCEIKPPLEKERKFLITSSPFSKLRRALLVSDRKIGNE